jgi:toxin ParE1/3/4
MARSSRRPAGAQGIVNLPVTIRSAAHADLREARDWYDRQREGLGNEFLLAVADAMLALEESPERQAFYYRDFRRVLTERFPYKIFYRVDGDAVIVYRVLHGARDHVRELE